MGSATIVIRTQAGRVEDTVVTDDQGRFSLGLDPGTYTLEPQELAGFPSIPSAVTVRVVADQTTRAPQLRYDTGVR